MKSNALHLVIACLGYYIAGRCGLLLAIPPGFASAVWPAAGVALACAITLPSRSVYIGVAFGSFLLNIGVASNGFTEITPSGAALALCISLGAATQTLLGFGLWRLLLADRSIHDSPTLVYRFLLIVAPVCCFASATIGTLTLTAFGILTPENVLFTGLTWWVGDTIGVILFTPLILTLTHTTLNTRYRLTIVIPTTVIFCGVLVLFHISLEAQNKAITDDLKRNATYLQNKIHERFSLAEQRLLAYTALYNTVEHVSRQQFNRMTEVLIQDNHALRAIGWTEVVLKTERADIENAVRAQGFPGFKFTELNAAGELITARERDRYYPVLMIYPLPSNLAAFGLDLGANPERFAALDLAMRTGKSVNTAPIVLAQAEGRSRSFIMYLPIFDLKYRRQFHTANYAQEHLRGYISGVFDIQPVLDDVFQEADTKHIGISIHDITPAHEPKLLIASDATPLASFDKLATRMTFGQRELALDFYANTEYNVATKDWTSWTILTIGVLLTAMLQALLLVLTGITERIKHEVDQKTDEYRQAKLDAEAASTAKTNFLANISHEFRTPLNAIIGFTNLCLKSPLNERQHGFLTRVQLASETLLALINHTLDYSNIEAHTIEIERKPLSIIHIYQKIEAIFAIQAEQKGLTFTLEQEGEHPQAIWGDALRLEQILLNLCSNAVKFTETGSITLRSTASRESHDQVDLTVSVIDTGIGIASGHQDEIFQAFQQADNSMSRRHGGTGLGLAISHQLITLMGGKITLHSVQGQGCTFSLHLRCDKVSDSYSSATKTSDESPQTQLEALEALHKQKSQNTPAGLPALAPTRVTPEIPSISTAPSTDPAPATLATPVSSEAPTLKPTTPAPISDDCLTGKTLLLVEDIEMNQILAQQMLEDYGAEILLANNGLEAVNCLKIQTVDAVLMDIQMPVMDGYEATRIIRNTGQHKTLPIIAMTANVAAQDIRACKEAGMNAHIGKPINEDLLLTTLMEQLHK